MDTNWPAAMSLLGRGDRDDRRHGPARRRAYEELLPYEGLVVVVARAAACNGPVDRVLGMLAADDWAASTTRSATSATRSRSRPGWATGPGSRSAASPSPSCCWRATSPNDRDRALELLSEVIGTAREMGARWIVDRALRDRLEAQGLTGVDVTTSIDDMVSELEQERPDMRAHAAPDGTVAILFSDIEDSTILTERLGDERWLQVLREHNSIFREQIARHDGYEVKSQGDGFMLAFPDPS